MVQPDASQLKGFKDNVCSVLEDTDDEEEETYENERRDLLSFMPLSYARRRGAICI